MAIKRSIIFDESWRLYWCWKNIALDSCQSSWSIPGRIRQKFADNKKTYIDQNIFKVVRKLKSLELGTTCRASKEDNDESTDGNMT